MPSGDSTRSRFTSSALLASVLHAACFVSCVAPTKPLPVDAPDSKSISGWVGGEVLLIGPRIENGFVRARLVGRNDPSVIGSEAELTTLTYEAWVDEDADGRLDRGEVIVEFLEAKPSRDGLSIDFERSIAELLAGLRDGMQHQVTAGFADGGAFIDSGPVPGSSTFRKKD